MRRREFIAGLGSAAVWPVVARAQQPERMRRIGVIVTDAGDRAIQARLAAFRQGLSGAAAGPQFMAMGVGDLSRRPATACPTKR
jgi:hypothetical protein